MKQNKKSILIILFAFLVSFFIIFSPNIRSFLNDFKKETALNIKQEIDTKKETKVIFKKETLNITKKDLLDTKDWKVYENEYLKFKYPANLYLYEREMYPDEVKSGLISQLRITPTKNPESPNNRGSDKPEIAWFMIDFKILKNSQKRPLKDWLVQVKKHNMYINLKIKDNVFFAPDFIKDNTIKEVYKSFSNDKYFFYAYFLIQIENKNFSKIFYTILSTLEFKGN